MKYELKVLSFGETIGKAITIYLNNFLTLFGITTLCNAPLIIAVSVMVLAENEVIGDFDNRVSLMVRKKPRFRKSAASVPRTDQNKRK